MGGKDGEATVRLPFQGSAPFYDLLYGGKDYVAEVESVSRHIRSAMPSARTILELGSGTGRHGRLLAEIGFHVHGIERSREMADLARQADGASSACAGSFTCEVGDLLTVRLRRKFDSVIALFHVIGYQTTLPALTAAFRTASCHLASGGLFIFDVWHGPAVLSQRPQIRSKEVEDARYHLCRTARPELDSNLSTVRVRYEITGLDRNSGQPIRLTEEHLMRYLFPDEVDLLARSSGLRRIGAEELLTGRSPSADTWSIAYLLSH